MEMNHAQPSSFSNTLCAHAAGCAWGCELPSPPRLCVLSSWKPTMINVLYFQFYRKHDCGSYYCSTHRRGTEEQNALILGHIFRKLTRPGRIGCCQACR